MKIDKRAAATNQALCQALITLLLKKPVEDLSVKELCVTAQIQRSTFYARYDNISQLLESLENDIIQEITSTLPAPRPDETRYSYALYQRIFEVLASHKSLSAVLLGKNSHRQFGVKLAGLLYGHTVKEWRELYHLTDPETEGFAFEYFAAGMLGMLHKWICEGQKESPAQLVALLEQFWQTGERSLLAPPVPPLSLAP